MHTRELQLCKAPAQGSHTGLNARAVHRQRAHTCSMGQADRSGSLTTGYS